MCHISAGRLGRQRGGSRIGEQIEHFRRRSPGPDQRPCPVEDIFPIRGLLGEDTDMLESRQAKPQGECRAVLRAGRSVADVPLVFHPFAAVPGAAVLLSRFAEAGPRAKTRVCETVPFRLRHAFVPQGFGFWPGQDIAAEAFEFFEIAAVNQFVVAPLSGGIFKGHRKEFCWCPGQR